MMSLRWTHGLRLVAAAALLGGCSLANDLEGYTGGSKDAAAGDSSTVTDSSIADSSIDSLTDSTATGDTADSAIDADADGTVVADSDAGSETSGDSDADGDAGTDADSASDTAPDVDAGPPVCSPVINEVQPGPSGSAAEEFVELYNGCSAAVNMKGWRLVYRAKSVTAAASVTSADTNTLTLPDVSIPAGGVALIAKDGSAYSKTPYTPLAVWSWSGIASDGGGMALRRPDDSVGDSVFWGTPTGGSHAFIETAATAVASGPASISRSPNGVDSNDNSKDFKSLTQSPGANNP